MKTAIALALLSALVTLSEANIVCYFSSWAVYRNGNGKFDVDDIDPFICTHMVFGFAGLGSDNAINVLDPWNELCDNYGKCAYDRFTALKDQNPNLVTMLSVGGWNEGSTKYSNMAADATARATFIESSVALLKEHNFDGLDMDWEYPGGRGGVPADKENYIILMSELGEALHAEGMILTAAVSAGKDTIDVAYDVPGLDAVVDFLNVMTYDLHGAWDTYTHHSAILYPYPEDEGENLYLNVDYGIRYWIGLGATPSKLMLGTALYGRCWSLDDPTNNGMYAPASQPGSPGQYTYSPGFMGYNEMCEHDLTSPWTVVNDPDMNEPYAYDLNFGNTWCSYDDSESLTTKAEYALEKGLGGIMIWSIETDDFLSQCHSRAFDLTKTLYETFSGGQIPTPEPTTTTTRDPNAPTVEITSTTEATTMVFPTSAPGEHCNQPGNNPDPEDCSFFYECVWNGEDYTEYIEYCAEGSLFNPIVMVCDFDYAVCALGDGICPANCPLSL